MTQNITAHNLGVFPLDATPELKLARNAYWQGNINQEQLEDVGRELRRRHWQLQADAGLDLISTGDFAWFDPVLSLSATLGNIPARHRKPSANHSHISAAPPKAHGAPATYQQTYGFSSQACSDIDLDTLFRVARGPAPSENASTSDAMARWFDSSQQYLVPEFYRNQSFALSWTQIIDETKEAIALGYQVKPVIIGPLTYLWLGKEKESDFNRLELLEKILPAYQQLLSALAETGAQWVQIDEPILALDLPRAWQHAFEGAYHRLQNAKLKILLATYFGALGGNITSAINLPVAGLHIDVVRAPEQLLTVVDRLPAYKVLSLNIVEGHNSWRSHLEKSLVPVKLARQRLGNRLWIAPSSALLHSDLKTHVA